MNYIYLVLVLIIVGLGWIVWKSYQHNEADKKEILALEKEKNEYEELGKGLAEYNQKLQEKKNQAKVKILEMLGAEAKVSNHDVAKALDISSATARRYFDDLETEGKAKQVGKSGKNVYYSKV